MLRHVRRLLISLAVVGAAWLLYALTIVPLVDPQVRHAADPGAANAAPDHSFTQTTFHERLIPLFPTGAWELDEPKVLETEQGVFLFRDYRELSDNRFEIRPCTLVAFPSAGVSTGEPGASGGRVVVVQAPQGAQLQFDSDSDLPRFKFGRLLGGRLPGEIRIWSREADGGQALDITTRNIQIEERRIWTPQEVRFKFGPSHGRGRDLEIRLQRTVPADGEGDDTAVGSALGNLQSFELVHLDELHLEGLGAASAPNAGGPETPTAPAADGAAQPKPFVPLADGPIDISCRGSAKFSVIDLVATLEDEVVVTRTTPLGPPDKLSCDLLTVVLRRTPGSDSPAAADTPQRTSTLQLEVERLIATGRSVDLSAPSQTASAHGQRLEINVPARRLRLEGGDGATLIHDALALSAVHLEYELPASRDELGKAWAQGPGKLVGKLPQAQSSARFEAAWNGELQLRPHEGLQVVSLTGGASIDYQGMGRFSADALHLWLRSGSNDAGKQPQLVADRMLAQGSVSIETRQLVAHTQRVEAWFRDSNGPDVADAKRSPTSRLVSQGPHAGDDPDAEPGAPAARFEISGELVRVSLLRLPAGSVDLETVEVTGQVVISELAASSAAGNPLAIRGDRLRLEQSSTGQGILRITGQPARVTAGGLTLVGAEVLVDQARNQLRIPGPGELTLPPMDLKPKPKAGVLYENPRAATAPGSDSVGRPTVITWKNGLEFDGQTARFRQDVQIRASQRLTTGEWLELLLMGGELEVRLQSPIVFADTDGPMPETAIDSLRFGGNVYLDGRTHVGETLTSLERLQIRNLTIQQATGQMSGEGPGWLAGTRHNENPAGGPGAGPKLMFLHIAFERGIEGNLVNRQVEFVGPVRAVFGPVADWQSEIDPQRPAEWPPDAIELRCERMSVAQQGGATPGAIALEMNSTGNVAVEGRKFVARAARFSYSQAKELFVFAGDGRSDADFWKKPAKPKPDATAATIMYWRRDGGVTVGGVKHADLNALGP